SKRDWSSDVCSSDLRAKMRSASSSSSFSGTPRSQPAVAAISPEKPTRPSWKPTLFSTVAATSRGLIRPLSRRSRRNATAEKPAMSVPSTSKKAPTAGPAGLSSTSRVMWAERAMAAGVREDTSAAIRRSRRAPLRAAWLPPEGGGARAARLSRLLSVGDPRDPGRLRQAQVLRRHPDRCRVVVAEPAPASELRERWRRTGGTDVGHTAGLSEFVARQAALALDRAERRLRGARYKVPRFVQ